MNHGDIESDRENYPVAGADRSDSASVDRNLSERYLRRGGRDPRIPLRPDRDGQSDLRAGLRAGVPEDDDRRVCHLPDSTYRELAD